MNRERSRIRLFLLSLAGVLMMALGWSLTGGFKEGGDGKTVLYVLGWAGMAGAVLFASDGGWRGIRIAIVVAVLARLLLLGAEATDDMNRYLWEGKLVREGISPYAQTAADPALAPQRDAYWEAMNHRDRVTIYPPVTLALFGLAGAVSYGPLLLKLLFLAADLGIAALLRQEIDRRGLSPRYLLLYLLNPAVLIGFAAEAHFDSWFILATVGALTAAVRGRPILAWGLLGLAVQLKWIPLLLVPWFLFHLPVTRRTLGVFAGVVVVPLVPFLGDFLAIIRGTVSFGSGSAFNGSLFELLLQLTGNPTTASVLAGTGFLLTAAGVLLVVRDPWRSAFGLFGALLLWSSVVHFWYLAWIAPFLALFPAAPWVLLGGSMALYFQVWANDDVLHYWGLTNAQQAWIWVPFLIVMAPGVLRAVRHGLARAFQPEPAGGNPGIGVVVPVAGEPERISRLVRRFDLEPGKDRWILALAEGDEASLRAAVEAGARYAIGPRGRGTQIAAALEKLPTSWVAICHADAVPPEGWTRTIERALAADREAVGGSYGQRFDGEDRPGLVVVEALNDLRAWGSGVSFGDQIQFFRRSALARRGGFPALRLMEDVELSLRLSEAGPVLYLGQFCRSSARAWTPGGFLARVRLVVSLTLRYRWERLRGRIGEDYFDRYYRK